jgi:hypothetical protein
MNLVSNQQPAPVARRLAACLVALSTGLSAGLSACGGGGGGGATAAAGAASDSASTTAAPTGVVGITPGATMTWATQSPRSLSFVVRGADGQPAAGAALRLFTVSRVSPQDGAALEEPVPMSLLDTVVSDADGRASVSMQWPGHVDELLVVATFGDTHGRALVGLQTADVGLQLAR